MTDPHTTDPHTTDRPGRGRADRRRVVVIGVGNDLRSDDGIGRRVAERIDALGRPDVVVRSVVQLLPELAIDLADSHRAIVVDARAGDGPGTDEIEVRRVTRRGVATSGPSTHHATPERLLELAALVGSAPGTLDVVSVPVAELGIGDGLSAAGAARVDAAVDLVVGLIDAIPD